ncbi:MAG: YdcF family protein, partial [Pseudomonadota bacterium]|nr:YdcF family protein [Pseudomonadota bacterium]
SRITLGLGFLILFALGLEPVADAVVYPLEHLYPSLDGVRLQVLRLHPPYWIVVLGNGHSDRQDVPALQLLNGTSLARLAEGLRLQRALPGSHLLLSGGSPLSGQAEAPVLEQAARELGANRNTLTIEDQSLDTADEARDVKLLVKDAPFVLVTSAVHMPRAMALFRHLGMKPIPAPTGFLGNPSAGLLDRYFPRSENLVVVQVALHEYLGLAFEYLTHQI